jgi:DNA-directed RNA polymerase subunit H (RpoH/RPB5)
MLKTVEYRGYSVPKKLILDQTQFDKAYSTLSVDKLKESFGNLMFDDIKIVTNKTLKNNKVNTNESSNTQSKKGRLLLKWVKDKKLGAGVRDVANIMKEEGIFRALIVADEGINPICKEILKNLKGCEKIIIDIWTLQESMIFVPDHVYVPKHRICTVKEKKSLYKAYGLKKKDLPWIRSDDVMVKYLGATKGQLIEITRPCDTNPNMMILSYRIVV